MNNILDEIRNTTQPVGLKKMNIKGTVKMMDVYRIPLDLLYYNDQNDRIATWISKYESEHGDITEKSVEERNEIIEDYIIKSDKQRFNDTMNNIKNLSQLEPGVVFIDGRVIDGNRRFTCLRKLFKDTADEKFNYFEAVILDNEMSEREIKLMELILQHGQEGKVDYNPIEKLVGIYRDIIKKELFDVKEYARSIDAKITEVEKSVELAKLMEDFLEYINANEQFYIARELEIDGPLNEIYLIKKRIGSDEEKWEKAKIALYDNMLMKTKNDENGSGDITRTIRDFGRKVINNDELFEDYFDKHEEYSRKIHDKINKCDGALSVKYIKDEIRSDKYLSDGVSKTLTDTLYSAKKEEAKKVPIELLTSVNSDISKLDLTAVSRLSGDDKDDFVKELDLLKKSISKIEDKINESI